MLQGRVNWQMSRVVGLGLGYRALYQDYSTGSGTYYFPVEDHDSGSARGAHRLVLRA
jgi:hypothetical protein